MTTSEAEELLTIQRPQDGRPVGALPVDGPDDVRRAVASARRAQQGWAAFPVRERVRRLTSLRVIIARRAEEIVDRIVAETGKPEAEALLEVSLVLGLMRHYERRAPRLLAPGPGLRARLAWKHTRITRQPWGVVAVMTPADHPFLLPGEPTITALYGGNGVVVKPSEHAPFSGAILPELVADAGLPPGLVEVVQGRGETGEALVGAGVDRVHLTGTAATARKVLLAAAPRLLPTSLALGAKDPALVLEDADLERAARGIAFGAFFHAGQCCLATERVYVVESVYEEFLRRVTREASSLRTGSAGEVDVGPLPREERLVLVEEQVKDALERGARALCGGQRLDPAANVFPPTVLADVTDRMRVMREETFGPLLPVMSVSDEDEAVRRANAHPTGHFASVWTGDRERGRAVAGRLRCGGVSINDTLSHRARARLPVGGVGETGYGSSRGDEGLLSMTRPRVQVEDRLGLGRDPWWFPYSRRTRRCLRAKVAWDGETGVRRVSRAVGALLGREES